MIQNLSKDNARPNRMTFPDGLRAIAALLVVLPHSVGLFAYWDRPSVVTKWVIGVSHIGSYGVQIFFVLSGFVIAYTLRNERINAPFIGRFILRRSVRLDPPYWVAIALMLGVLGLQRHFGRGGADWPSPGALVAHLFYLQDVLGYGNINVVFWTLCIEIQFYLTFCVVLAAGQSMEYWPRTRWASPQNVVFILLVLSLLVPAGVLPISGVWFLHHWYGFLCGVATWHAVSGAFRIWPIVCVGLIMLAIAVAQQSIAPAAVAITSFSLLLCAFSGGLYSWLDNRPVQLIGALSYCIYLVHVPIHALILPVFVRLAPRHEIMSYLFFAISVSLYIAGAYVLHRSVERPALYWSARLKGRSPSDRAPIVSGLTEPA